MKQKQFELVLLLSLSLSRVLAAESAAATPLTIEAVECRGNHSTSCEFIQRKLGVQTGTAVDDDAVQSAQLRLSALSNFESVRVFMEKGSDVGKARLIVEVVEANPIVTEYGLAGQYLSADFEDPRVQAIDQWAGSTGFRVSNQNLLGRHKIAAFGVFGGYVSGTDLWSASASATASYIDPNVLGAERLFMSIAGNYGYQYSEQDRDVGYYDPNFGAFVSGFSRLEQTSQSISAAASIGYRLWSYSYLFASYSYAESETRAELKSPYQYNPVASSSESRSQVARLGLGWDSEDDAYFPTRGSRLSITARYLMADVTCDRCPTMNRDEESWRAAFKSTWSLGSKSVVTVGVGGEPEAASDELRPFQNPFAGDLGLTYSYVLSDLGSVSGPGRSRWYLHLGTGPFELQTDGRIGGEPEVAHIALGLRFENRALGLVNLYAMGSRYWPDAR